MRHKNNSKNKSKLKQTIRIQVTIEKEIFSNKGVKKSISFSLQVEFPYWNIFPHIQIIALNWYRKTNDYDKYEKQVSKTKKGSYDQLMSEKVL